MSPSRQLILIYLGKADSLPGFFCGNEWKHIYMYAGRQEIIPICYRALCRIPSVQRPDLDLWQRDSDRIAIVNERLASVGRNVREYFASQGLRSCILKGAVFGSYYPSPSDRSCGDVDIWVEGSRKEITDAIKKKYHIEKLLYNECGFKTDGMVVDIHFQACKMENPFLNRKLQKYFEGRKSTVMDRDGFDPEFNLVFAIVHTFRHCWKGGANIRHLLDCYFILSSAGEEVKKKAMIHITALGLGGFTAELMYCLGELCQLDGKDMLCPPDATGGRELLAEIISSPLKLRMSGWQLFRTKFKRYYFEVAWGPVLRFNRLVWKALH